MKHKTRFITTISIAITIPLFFVSRILGTIERGNQSMGAEMLLVLIPIIVWLFSNVLQSIVTMMLLNGEVIPWVAVLFIIITGIISLGCIPIFIIFE